MVSHEVWTGLLLLLSFVLAGLAGLFYTFSQADVTGIPEHDNGDDKLRSASGNLLIAYILAFIAAGILLVLAILYMFQPSLQISEIPHTILFILIFALLIVSIIFGFIALSDIDESGVSDKKGSVNWLWGGFAMAIAALVIIILSGAWRFQHVQSKKAATVETQKVQTTFTSPNVEKSTTALYAAPGYKAAPAFPMTPSSP